MSPKYAFVTLATNDNYAKSAIVLANTIKKTQSNADLICLVPQDTYEKFIIPMNPFLFKKLSSSCCLEKIFG